MYWRTIQDLVINFKSKNVSERRKSHCSPHMSNSVCATACTCQSRVPNAVRSTINENCGTSLQLILQAPTYLPGSLQKALGQRLFVILKSTRYSKLTRVILKGQSIAIKIATILLTYLSLHRRSSWYLLNHSRPKLVDEFLETMCFSLRPET